MKKQKNYSLSKRRSDLIFVCVMLAFPILQFCIMWIGVNFNSILLAFKEYDADFNFTWTLNNFTRVFRELSSSVAILGMLKNGFIFWFFTTVMTLPVSLLISYYLYKGYKFSRGIKVGLFIPSLMAGVVTVTVFYLLVDRAYPMLIQRMFGKSVMGLLVNSNTQFGTILFYNVFYHMASNFLYLSSAMSTVDESLSDAARVDGATPLQEFFYVTLPSIYNMLTVLFITSIPGIFISDFSLVAIFKTSRANVFGTMGSYFTLGLLDGGQATYPYYSAFGMVLSVAACILTFTARYIVDRMDPMADVDGTRARKKKEKLERRRGK